MYRVPVLSAIGQPLMPTKPSRARRWTKEGKAVKKWSKLGVFLVELVQPPSDTKTQPIAVGIDPGKKYSGIGVVSAKQTLLTAHLELPFPKVKERMEQRRLMRRGRRGRRINRKLPFNQRAHRQSRKDNRRGHKLPPSVRANRQLELRVVADVCKLFPISNIFYEYVEAIGSQSFSPVMVGQKFMLQWLEKYAPVTTKLGWQTANMREKLGLFKQKHGKKDPIPATHAIDGVALAAYGFLDYKPFHFSNAHGHEWRGEIVITEAPFIIVKRPPISRRHLHLMLPSQGGKRRKYGGTTTRHGVRKGDFVRAEKSGRIYYGWVSGDTEKQISVSAHNWKRLGQFTARKVELLQRSTGLICQPLYGGAAFLPSLGREEGVSCHEIR